MKIGLTLGKFAPLHRGHQHVIDTALAEMDHLILLVYDCPGVDTLPLPVRAAWLRRLYPQVEVIEIWDGPTETGMEPRITQLHDAYLVDRFGQRNITHFYSSEPYGQHVSRALQCEDRRVDLDRSKFPVSATQIRSNPYEFRQYIDPLVWRDLITWVVFLGAPCTGKSTIAQALAARHSTLWMPEYGREYWEAHQVNRRLSKEQLLFIAQEHRRREELYVRDAQRYLFVDTDASTTLQFSYYYHQAAEPQLLGLANDARQRYDLFFLCETDIPYSSTWDRSGDVARLEMQRRIEADLLARRIPVFRLQGNLDDRCQQVESVLSRFRKTH
jgi:NadR type nicotinamide-nucleotide adenylyltransferase